MTEEQQARIAERIRADREKEKAVIDWTADGYGIEVSHFIKRGSRVSTETERFEVPHDDLGTKLREIIGRRRISKAGLVWD